jgi:hypothetical protein
LHGAADFAPDVLTRAAVISLKVLQSVPSVSQKQKLFIHSLTVHSLSSEPNGKWKGNDWTGSIDDVCHDDAIVMPVDGCVMESQLGGVGEMIVDRMCMCRSRGQSNTMTKCQHLAENTNTPLCGHHDGFDDLTREERTAMGFSLSPSSTGLPDNPLPAGPRDRRSS